MGYCAATKSWGTGHGKQHVIIFGRLARSKVHEHCTSSQALRQALQSSGGPRRSTCSCVLQLASS